LHQAITDVMPERLDFYEEWLDPVGLRNGTVGLAPLSAVTGFLRTEGDNYDAVMARAGMLGADWALAARPPYWRRLGAALPARWRLRFGLREARRIVREVLSTSSASSRFAKGRATMRIDSSVFCDVRDPVARPLCAFYRALIIGVLRAFQVSADATIDSCHAVGGGSCVIAIVAPSRARANRAALAA
jgi:hypothetical protein